MLLKFATDVFNHEDKKIGELESVIIDPATQEISHLIVKKGFLFTRDKLVPISLVAYGDADQIKLHAFEGTIEDLQDFEETHFITLDNYINNKIDGKIIPMMFYSPLSRSQSYAAQLTSIPVIKKRLPFGKESIQKGVDVVSLDDEVIGSVKELVLDPRTDRISHLLVADGLLFKREFMIPIEWVKSIENSRLDLFVDSKVVEKIPEGHLEGV